MYTLGAIAWYALTGVLPYDEGSPFLRDYSALPELAEIRPDIPEGLSQQVRSCLSEMPDSRPNSAQHLLDILEGHSHHQELAIERVRCQACGHSLRLGLRLCLHCGKTAVQFFKAEEGPGFTLLLGKAEEDEDFDRRLRRLLEDIGEGPPPELDFLVGDAQMYSKSERQSRIALPAALFTGLSQESASALEERFSEQDFKVKSMEVKPVDATLKSSKQLITGGLVALPIGVIALGAAISSSALWAALGGVALATCGIGMLAIGMVRRRTAKRPPVPALSELRQSPLALPSSDPFVARLGALLGTGLADDVREQVSQLALLVQRLCDHRTGNDDAADTLNMLLEPLSKVVDMICQEVLSITAIDQDMKALDEGTLIRAMAASEARGEDSSRRAHYLEGLDKLRQLEDRRAEHMGALLQAATLLKRSVHLGLSETHSRLLESSRVTMALAQLGK